jgi:hypothetical protein
MAFKLPNPSPFKKVSDSSFFTDSMREGFSAGRYGSYSNPSLDPQTYALDGVGDAIASTGEKLASAIADRKKMMTTSRDVPDMTNKIEYPKVEGRTPGASPDLESKIKTAKSRGNLKRAARLEGRQDRRVERQTQGAERIEARQAEKTAKVKQRQEDKTKKSIDTSTDGSNLQMKNNSPNKFLGGIAASIGAGMTGAGSGMDNNAFREKLRSSIFGGAAFEAMQRSQAQRAAAGAATVPAIVPEATINDGVDPVLAGAGVVPPGTTDPGNPFEGKTFQITPANMMGNAKPMFSAPVQASAEAIYGTPLQRQMSMPKSGSVTRMSAKQEKAFGPESKVYESGNTAIYDGLKAEDNSPNAMSPLNSYENPQTVIDRSHGYVASKAAEAFGKISEELIKKKKGDNDDENKE